MCLQNNLNPITGLYLCIEYHFRLATHIFNEGGSSVTMKTWNTHTKNTRLFPSWFVSPSGPACRSSSSWSWRPWGCMLRRMTSVIRGGTNRSETTKRPGSLWSSTDTLGTSLWGLWLPCCSQSSPNTRLVVWDLTIFHSVTQTSLKKDAKMKTAITYLSRRMSKLCVGIMNKIRKNYTKLVSPSCPDTPASASTVELSW